MFCSKCGKELIEEAVICPSCGAATEKFNAKTEQPSINIVNTNSNTNTMAFPQKSKMVALVLAILLGGLGIHRFYVGKIGTGLLWMVTAGFFGIGWILDIIFILTGSFRDKSGMPLK